MLNGRMRFMIAMLLASSTALVAQSTIDEKADALMKRMASELDSASTLAFSAETSFDEVTASGQKLQRSALASVLVRRPDRILAVRDGDRGVRKFSYDGRTMTLYDPGLELYASAEVPGKIDDALAFLRRNYDLVLPLGDLIQAGFYEEVRPKVTSGRYLGRHRVGRIPCHHVAYTMENADWQVWIEDGPSPLPRKIVITYKTLPLSPQFTAIIGEWRISEPMPDKMLEMIVPAEASRIEILGKEGEQ